MVYREGGLFLLGWVKEGFIEGEILELDFEGNLSICKVGYRGGII